MEEVRIDNTEDCSEKRVDHDPVEERTAVGEKPGHGPEFERVLPRDPELFPHRGDALAEVEPRSEEAREEDYDRVGGPDVEDPVDDEAHEGDPPRAAPVSLRDFWKVGGVEVVDVPGLHFEVYENVYRPVQQRADGYHFQEAFSIGSVPPLLA